MIVNEIKSIDDLRRFIKINFTTNGKFVVKPTIFWSLAFQDMLFNFTKMPSKNSSELLYCALNGIDEPKKCNICKVKNTKFSNFNGGYRDYCSPKCANLDPDIRQRIEHTSMQRYGTKNGLGFGSNKTKQSMIEKYGYENASHSKEIRQKTIKTNLNKYGFLNVFQSEVIKDKIKTVMLDRHGPGIGLSNAKIRSKIETTMNTRYGVSYPASSPVLFDKIMKHRFKFKNIDINGNNYQYQGYENVVLDHFKKYKLINIRSELPNVLYIDEFGKPRIYYPDLYIPEQNTIVEVKSEYTFYAYENIKTHILKAKAVKNLGYEYFIYICDKNKILKVLSLLDLIDIENKQKL